MTAVVDASVLVKWFVEEPGADEARILQGHSLFAPDLVVVETINVLWKKVRMNSFRASDVGLAVGVLRSSGLSIIPSLSLAARAFEIAHDLDHAAYDCFYLALAEVRGLPMITADDSLGRKLAQRPSSHAQVVSLTEHLATLKGA